MAIGNYFFEQKLIWMFERVAFPSGEYEMNTATDACMTEYLCDSKIENNSEPSTEKSIFLYSIKLFWKSASTALI